MIEHITKIVYISNGEMYLKYSGNGIREINIKDIIKDMPDWQKNIVKERWNKAKIVDGHIYFSELLSIGADTVKKISKEPSTEKLFDIVSHKRISKKKILQSLASLL